MIFQKIHQNHHFHLLEFGLLTPQRSIRSMVELVPAEAEVGISYNVPFYTFHDTHVGFAAFKNLATFGIGADALRKEDRQMLEEKGYKTGKETIQIRYDQAVPTTETTQLLVPKVEEARKAQ